MILTVAHGQGSLILRTEDPIFDVDMKTPLEGEAFLAQLYAGPTERSLAAIGSPLPFGTGARTGRVVGGQQIIVPGPESGWPVSVQVRAWQTSDGRSYEAAVAARGHFGVSKIIRVIPGDPYAGGVPGVPPRLEGLGSFALSDGPVPARLTLVSPAAQTLSLSILAQPATQWEVYSSRDLTSWHAVRTLTIDATGEAKVQLSPEGSEPAFYRAVLGP